jgi:hypothetical protein
VLRRRLSKERMEEFEVNDKSSVLCKTGGRFGIGNQKELRG